VQDERAIQMSLTSDRYTLALGRRNALMVHDVETRHVAIDVQDA